MSAGLVYGAEAVSVLAVLAEFPNDTARAVSQLDSSTVLLGPVCMTQTLSMRHGKRQATIPCCWPVGAGPQDRADAHAPKEAVPLAVLTEVHPLPGAANSEQGAQCMPACCRLQWKATCAGPRAVRSLACHAPAQSPRTCEWRGAYSGHSMRFMLPMPHLPGRVTTSDAPGPDALGGSNVLSSTALLQRPKSPGLLDRALSPAPPALPKCALACSEG
jgi:hypothetical protein